MPIKHICDKCGKEIKRKGDNDFFDAFDRAWNTLETVDTKLVLCKNCNSDFKKEYRKMKDKFLGK